MKTQCSKCGFESEENHNKSGLPFCKVCLTFAPDDPEELDKYVEEKINPDSISAFRKHAKLRGVPQKQGMIQKAFQGEVMSRPPFGYKIANKKLIPAQNADEVREIFEEFLQTSLSLRKLSEKHNLSVNGLKKILRNFTYVGKIRFNGQIHDGSHKPILSTTLFNHVQNKLERLKIKRN